MGQVVGWVTGQVTYRSTSRMRLLSLFTTWIRSSVCAKFTRPFLSTWNWGETARSAVWARCLLPKHAHVARDPQAWHGASLEPFNTPQLGLYPSPSELRGIYSLYRESTLKGDLPSNMWKVTYPCKQPQRWMVTCTSSVLTMAPVMLESRLMNSSSNCLTLSGISLMMILTRWSSRRM